jgi:hypothetical protein
MITERTPTGAEGIDFEGLRAGTRRLGDRVPRGVSVIACREESR